jgi:flagellar biosynthetic protein FlhB
MPEMYGDKRHEATPYRRQQAREQGQVARSADLVSAAVLLAAIGGLKFFASVPAQTLYDYTAHQLRSVHTGPVVVGDVITWIWTAATLTARILAPWLLALWAVAALAHLIQTGLLFLPEKVVPNWSHINPVRGWQRIFSLTNFVRIGFGILKMATIFAIAATSVWSERDRMLSLTSLDGLQLTVSISDILLDVCFRIAVILLILALLDYLFQYWKHEQDIRMTDQELREELRLLQGDPQIVARRRVIQRQMVMNRLPKVIPTADFVVTNPTEIAVAIRYDMETMPAPIVVAKGAGVLAQRIRKLALEHNIPIIERKALARILYEQVEVNQPIPVEQYAAVAEILRYVYQLKGKPLPQAA